METPTKKSKFGLIVVIVVMIILALVFFGSRGNPTGSIVPKTRVEAGVGKDILASLLQLNSLKVDREIFNNQIFLSLQDFGVSLAEQPRGRSNPFAPIGR